MFRISAHLQRHPLSGIFYFRIIVPTHLKLIIRKTEIKKSLGTGLKSEALIMAQGIYFETCKLFQRAEKTMKKGSKSLPDSGFFEKIELNIKGQKVVIERDNPQEEAEVAARLLGMVGPSATAVKTASKTEDSVLLAQMIKLFVAEKKTTGGWTQKSTEENEAIFQLLKEITKNPAVNTINLNRAVEFKNTLLQLPPNRTKGHYEGKDVKMLLKMKHEKTLSVASVNKYLRRISPACLIGVNVMAWSLRALSAAFH